MEESNKQSRGRVEAPRVPQPTRVEPTKKGN